MPNLPHTESTTITHPVNKKPIPIPRKLLHHSRRINHTLSSASLVPTYLANSLQRKLNSLSTIAGQLKNDITQKHRSTLDPSSSKKDEEVASEIHGQDTLGRTVEDNYEEVSDEAFRNIQFRFANSDYQNVRLEPTEYSTVQKPKAILKCSDTSNNELCAPNECTSSQLNMESKNSYRTSNRNSYDSVFIGSNASCTDSKVPEVPNVFCTNNELMNSTEISDVSYSNVWHSHTDRHESAEREPCASTSPTSNYLRLTQSIIDEFDPLLSSLEFSYLEDTPPPPPVRNDSLLENDTVTLTPEITEKSNNIESEVNVNKETQDNKAGRWLKSVRGVLDKSLSRSKAVIMENRLNAAALTSKMGMLYKVQNGAIEDIFDGTASHVKEKIVLNNILSIQTLLDAKCKYRYDNSDLHCFEMTVMKKNRHHIYGSRYASERNDWLYQIAQSLCSHFGKTITSDLNRMGWAYLREGITGKWTTTWLLLKSRSLYYIGENSTTNSIDLRKVRHIALQPHQSDNNDPVTDDNGPTMVINTCDNTVYIREWNTKEIKIWCHAIKMLCCNNGAHLNQQQLTKCDVPVIVEKCINFVYTHGSMSKGVYRKSGTSSIVADVLTEFRKNAWDVQLTTDKYTVNDVATALKRFFRDLPEPLLGGESKQYFQQAVSHENQEEKIDLYKTALTKLPEISYKTTKKLINHLHFISTQSTKNLMTEENLASIWGPTLFHIEQNDYRSTNISNSVYIHIAIELIQMYKDIFVEDSQESEQEQLMLEALKLHSSQTASSIQNKQAGDFRIWIYLHNKEGQTFNILINPTKTAYDVCSEVAISLGIVSHNLVLKEVILSGKLSRSIHFNENVLNIVLEWGYWDEIDRKDNHLVVTDLSKCDEIMTYNESMAISSSELKFADSGTKTLKAYTFDLTANSLVCYKEPNCTTILFSWNFEDIIWYFGHDPKRNPESEWTVTILHKNVRPNRTKQNVYFGSILVWRDSNARSAWLQNMFNRKYGENLLHFS